MLQLVRAYAGWQPVKQIEVQRPVALAYWAGELYVLTGKLNVSVYQESSGLWCRVIHLTWPNRPHMVARGLAVNDHGLFLSGTATKDVIVFTHQGRLFRRFSSPEFGWHCTVSKNYLWLESPRAVLQVTFEGYGVGLWETRADVSWELVVSEDEKEIWLSDMLKGYIYCHKLEEGETRVHSCQGPMGLALLGSQALAVAECGGQRVIILNRKTGVLLFAHRHLCPDKVVATNDTRFWVSNPTEDSVTCYDWPSL